jgi:MtN3 and saliva related transmembrane protein
MAITIAAFMSEHATRPITQYYVLLPLHFPACCFILVECFVSPRAILIIADQHFIAGIFMYDANILGLVAGSLTTLSFIPQVIKIWRSKHARDISSGMFSIFSLGVLLWLIYGIQIESLPVIIANALTLGLSLVILAFKIKYK